MKLLVFPTDCEANTELYVLLERLGIPVVGASSTKGQNFLGKHTFPLPYITDDGFLEKIKLLVCEHEITHFHTSHAGVWGVLKGLVESNELSQEVTLCSEFPFDAEWLRFEKYAFWAKAFLRHQHLSGSHCTLREDELAALCKQYNEIPGQCDNHKLESLISIAPKVPVGDWVEIGSLYGRSSFALGFLAQHFCQASLICVDPWDSVEVLGQKGKAEILDKQGAQIDYSKIFKIFQSSIGLLRNVSYIKALSKDGIKRYLKSDLDGSPVNIDKEIAFLHIDGNHHFDEVSKDIALWEPHVCVEGWVAIDDYLWAFGDGPKRAGDLLLASKRFDLAFVMGDTLYMRKLQKE